MGKAITADRAAPDRDPAPGRGPAPRRGSRPARAAWAAAIGAALLVVAPAAHAQSVSGRLLDLETDLPIPLGLVMMYTEEGDSVTATIADASGRFTITAREPGSFTLLAAALGYHETPAGVFELGDDGEMTVEYRLRPAPLPIDELIVSLDRPTQTHHLVRNGFVRRFQRGLGVFVTPHDIEESSATTTEQLLQGKPGIRVGTATVQRGSGANTVAIPRPDIGETVQVRSLSGGWCVPRIYIDGILSHYNAASGFTLNSMAQLGVVEAIEVYRRPAEIPVEYSTGPGSGCGVLVLWTRQGQRGFRTASSGALPASEPGDPTGRTLPEAASISESPPVAGESIRLQVTDRAARESGVDRLWQGDFIEIQDDRLVANDPDLGRAIAIPVDGIEALQVERLRPHGYAYRRAVIGGTAFGAGTYLFLRILCRSVCDLTSASALAPSLIAGTFVGSLIYTQGPGTRWMVAPVRGESPDGAPGASFSIRLPVR